tara:strand:- start:270 stop:500 length:231 start_codon:yes stop_codon:yes gene_type:complete
MGVDNTDIVWYCINIIKRERIMENITDLERDLRNIQHHLREALEDLDDNYVSGVPSRVRTALYFVEKLEKELVEKV